MNTVNLNKYIYILLGPAHWVDSYPDCGLTHQSPININDKDVSYSSSLEPIVLGNYKETMPDVTFRLANYGASVKVTILRKGISEKSPIHIIHEG